MFYPMQKGVIYVILKESVKSAWDGMHGMTFLGINMNEKKQIGDCLLYAKSVTNSQPLDKK